MFWVFFLQKTKNLKKKIKLKNKIKLKRNKTILTAFIIFFNIFLVSHGNAPRTCTTLSLFSFFD